MANKKRGYYVLKMGGKNRTLHFSMNFWAEFTDLLNIDLSQIDKVFSQGLKISTIRAIIYCAAKANDLENGVEVDYNEYQVGKWLEDVTPEQFNEIVQSMTESRILGNDLNMGLRRNSVKSSKETKK